MAALRLAKARTSVKVYCARDPELESLIKSVVGYEWSKAGGCWIFPLDYHTLKELSTRIADRIGWEHALVDPELVKWMRQQSTVESRLAEIRAESDGSLSYEQAPTLYAYQRVMVRFMAAAGRVLNTDQMGLGKTPETIAAIREIELSEEPRERRYLVICPNSLKGNWRREILTWYGPDADVVMVKSGKELVGAAPGWYVVNWEKTHRRPELGKVKWDVIVADEAHRMKGRDTKQSKATRKLSAPRIFCLTGTPIKNEVTDLWPVLNWLYPERYSSFWRFFEMYVDYRETFFGKEVVGIKNEERLRRSLHGVMFGRKLEDIDDQLPAVTPKRIVVELGAAQRKAYNQMREEFITWIEGGDGEVVAQNWMTQALRLKQIAGSTHILDSQNPESAKIDALMDLLDEVPAGEKFVVMTQFRSMVTLVTDRLREQKIGFCEMMGGGHNRAYLPSVGYRDAPERDELIQWFQGSDKPRVFVCTMQTGGEGITLTAARYFAFLDLPWVPADVEQAWKRVHRRGQTRACFVYTILAKDTIDFSAILPTLKRKQDVIDRMREPADPETVEELF